MARLRQLIEAERQLGDGTFEDPFRIVFEYYDPAGDLVVRGEDPLADVVVCPHCMKTWRAEKGARRADSVFAHVGYSCPHCLVVVNTEEIVTRLRQHLDELSAPTRG